MKIFRKRYIPNEIVDISGDEVVYQDDKLIVTKWLPIRPRKDIGSGISYAMLDKGWKISRIFDGEGNFSYWYCDIIDDEINEKNGETEYTLIDLLVDVKVYPDGTYEVLDKEELDEALQTGLITKEQKEMALAKLNALLDLIQNGNFPPQFPHI